MKNQSGNIVRTLVDETRAPGTYSDPWDGLDDGGNLLPKGPYYAVLEYDFFGEVRTIDLTNTTGGSRSSPPRTTIPSSFSPFAGQPLTIDFTLNRASEVLAFIGRFRVNTRLVTFLNRDPLGKGTHRITWNGDLAEGQLIHPPSGDRFLFGIFAYSLPSNAIYVRSGAHPSDLSVAPPIFDPSGHVDDQGTPERSAITFSLNKSADVELIVNDATTGSVVATRAYTGLTSGQNAVFWDGRDDNGVFVAPGRYRIGIAAIDNTGYKSLKIYAVQRIYY
jgi:flagellar hook assembly protein FlgD